MSLKSLSQGAANYFQHRQTQLIVLAWNNGSKRKPEGKNEKDLTILKKEEKEDKTMSGCLGQDGNWGRGKTTRVNQG